VVEGVYQFDIIDNETTAECKRKVRKKFEEAIKQKHKPKMFQDQGTKGKPAGIRRMVGADGG
jgi:hypothetical protein